MRRVAIALVHHPVVSREKDIITTAITNLDVHDISRSAKTFGVERFYVVHPIDAQQELVRRVKAHWTTGAGAKRIPDRAGALDLVEIVPSLEAAEAAHGAGTERWTTAARSSPNIVEFPDARALLRSDGPPVMIVYGTGWGLAASVLDAAHVRIAPIRGVGPWNHLSVRAAVAISLDRLLSP